MTTLKGRTLVVVIVVVCLLLAAVLLTVLWSRRGAAQPAPGTTVAQASALTVELAAAESRDWPQELHASGAVAAWEEIVVSPETGGLRIAELLVNAGDRVVRGQLLARLADDTVRAELAKQRALVAQAEASLQQAASNLQRARSVDVAGALSPQKLDEYQAADATARAALASAQADLQSAQLKLSQTRIVASDAGIVASKSGVVGNVASVGTELYRLIRQGRIEWRAELDARQLALVATGQLAEVQLPGGQAVAGRVRLVSPTLSTSTGRGIVYVSLDTSAAARAGIFVNGTIALQRKPAVTLPDAAVTLRDGRSYVHLVGNEGQVASRPVVTGRRQGERVEIVTGLDAGALVVAKGGAFLSDGAMVTVVSSTRAAAPQAGTRR